MPDYVLTCRIYFPNAGTAKGAFEHLESLALQGAAISRQVGGIPDTSWIRVHECFAEEDDGDTSRCVTSHRFVMNEEELGEEAILWEPNQTVEVDDKREYEGTVYRCLQAHTTQVGWEPPNTPALWEVVSTVSNNPEQGNKP